ncbi:cell division protein FtsQ [Pedobacter rhodius]|uniref:Cell division protein FtsQ n=1 Tax=Pedobacter rhodius TaxID=3004098 RepID=A0ABT4KSD6_9SPHI|nr:cell division protein FtsQ [Pedobacter sp. SJ11]MCZ4221846.1 cell division protein FtsQ [Pedobacter sp. SJ11]
MLKRINWSAIFTGFAWLISLAGVVVLLSFISVKKQGVKCTEVKILIPGADNFIEREEVDQILREDQGVLVGRKLEQINIHQIEQKLRANPYIGFAKVYADMDGVLRIEIKQRQPILRILNLIGQDFYIDNDGLKMPISPNFTADVLVATGNIQEVFGSRIDTLRTQLARDLYKTAQYIKRDTLWDNQIEQIAVNERNDMVLVPRVGDETIILGSADSLDVKMKNLKVFYKHALPQVIARKYRTINIKYTNQIVCEKRDSSLIAKKDRILSGADSINITRKVSDSLIRSSIAGAMKSDGLQDDRNAEQREEKPVTVAKPKPATVPEVKPKTVAAKSEVKKEKPKTESPKPAVKQEQPKANETKPAPKKEKPKTAEQKPEVKKTQTFAEKMAKQQAEARQKSATTEKKNK